MIKPTAYILCILMALAAMTADAAIKKKSKKKLKKSTLVVSPYVISIGHPNIDAAFKFIKARSDVMNKSNGKPFGWQQRSGPWYVVTEKPNFEWAFTEPGHYAHPSVVKRMIDIGSKDHVYVDMAFKCGAENRPECDRLFTELKEVNLLIRKVYQKQYIVSEEGVPAWDGVDRLD